MRHSILISLLLLVMVNHVPTEIFAQGEEKVRWMSFEEMEAAFAEEPKHVFIDFWADWCGACKRMEKYVFSNPEIAKWLNTDFYPIRMNAETMDSIYFGGKLFVNSNPGVGRKGKGFHELAVLLGKDEQGQFSLPTILIYNTRFEPVARYHRYLNSKKMLDALVISSK
jgi:thiol-disulfide isomerase/thioredoxin